MGKFAEDIARYRTKGNHGKNLWLNPAVWAIGCYRASNWLVVTRPNVVVRIPLKLLVFVGVKFCEVFMEMCIDPQATIGGGLYISHIGGVHINPEAVLGRNCDIAHRTTIGNSAMGRRGAPTLGDNVYVGTGAALIGKIKIGNGAKIAANTLVISNVPEGSTVMGVPGRVVMRPIPPKAAPAQAAPLGEPLHAN